MFTDANQLQLADLFLNLLRVCLQSTFLDCSLRNCLRQCLKIKISDISLIPLEIRVISKEFIKFVPSGLTLKQNVLTMGFELLLYLCCNSVGKDAFACSKLNINEFRSNQFVLKSFIRYQLCLQMIICCVLKTFQRTAFNICDSFSFLKVSQVQIKHELHNFLKYLLINQSQVRHLQSVSSLLVVFLCFIYILREPITIFLFLFIEQFGTVLKMFFQLFGRNKKPLLIGAFYLILKITTMCGTIFRSLNNGKLAHPLFSYQKHLTSCFVFLLFIAFHFQIYLLGRLLYWLLLLLLHNKRNLQLKLRNSFIQSFRFSDPEIIYLRQKLELFCRLKSIRIYNIQSVIQLIFVQQKMSKVVQRQKKQVRKPISDKFAPKRLAIAFEPPTIIMEYLAIDSGKLYHHKMRLDSILKRGSTNRIDILNYIKNKHYLYFVGGKIKDNQLLKFIDKILAKTGKGKTLLTQINQNVFSNQRQQPQDDDFDYLNDDEDYDEQYEDYEQPEDKPQIKMETRKENVPVAKQQGFLNSCKQYEDSEGGAEWDLDMEEEDYV